MASTSEIAFADTLARILTDIKDTLKGVNHALSMVAEITGDSQNRIVALESEVSQLRKEISDIKLWQSPV
jgi:capsule polysaccharide export protein KpsE/RkpR